MIEARNDIPKARECHMALRRLIIDHAGGWHDKLALRKLGELCRAALSALNDRDCIDSIGRLEDLAENFFSDDAHYQWRRPGMIGVATLKMEMLKTLAGLRSRIASMEIEGN